MNNTERLLIRACFANRPITRLHSVAERCYKTDLSDNEISEILSEICDKYLKAPPEVMKEIRQIADMWIKKRYPVIGYLVTVITLHHHWLPLGLVPKKVTRLQLEGPRNLWLVRHKRLASSVLSKLKGLVRRPSWKRSLRL